MNHKAKAKMSKWIEFRVIEPPIEATYKPKTQCWMVLTEKSRVQLGIIKWSCGWRKYTFYPHSNTLFEQDCLRDIANFIEEQTKKHKEDR